MQIRSGRSQDFGRDCLFSVYERCGMMMMMLLLVVMMVVVVVTKENTSKDDM